MHFRGGHVEPRAVNRETALVARRNACAAGAAPPEQVAGRGIERLTLSPNRDTNITPSRTMGAAFCPRATTSLRQPQSLTFVLLIFSGLKP